MPSNVQSITLAETRNDRTPPKPAVARFARNTQFEIFPFPSPTTAPNLFELFPMNSQSLRPSVPLPCHQSAPPWSYARLSTQRQRSMSTFTPAPPL